LGTPFRRKLGGSWGRPLYLQFWNDGYWEKLVGAGEMFTFTVLIGLGESISKARRNNSITKGL